MKKIIKPAQKEEATYYSNFSGKVLGSTSPIDIVIDFNYESGRDGDRIEWHITDIEFKELIKLIKNKYDLIEE